jgi:pimeloyl-ACP methyl ester carboxylesterase
MPVVRRDTSNHLHSPHTNGDDIAEFRERAKSIDRNSYIRRLQIPLDDDIRDRLGQIDAPTVFLVGDRDRLLPSVRWGTTCRIVSPNSSLTVLEGCGSTNRVPNRPACEVNR